MSFNYRIIRFRDKTCRNGYYYAVHTVYYDKFGKPKSYGDPPASIGGETIKECFEDMIQKLSGMAKPYLKEEDFGK